MAGQFLVLDEQVILVKYTGQIRRTAMGEIGPKTLAFAEGTNLPLLLVMDLTGLNIMPKNLLSLALRQGEMNPIRNPKIKRIVGITNSPFLTSMASTVMTITGKRHIVVVQTWKQTQNEIEMFLQEYAPVSG